MNAAVLAAGIFAHESGQRLLHILLTLGERGFKGLYDKCHNNLTGDYYQTGLRRVHAWSDEVILDDLASVRRQCPDLEETYEACFVNYVSDRFRGRTRTTTRPPLVLEFARRFLESLGHHEALATGDYFAQRDTMLKRVACMDAARQALYALVTTENVRVELASEVGSSVAPSRHLAEATPEEVAAVDDVAPGDSVSQVGVRVPPPRPMRTPSQASRAPPSQIGRGSVAERSHVSRGVPAGSQTDLASPPAPPTPRARPPEPPEPPPANPPPSPAREADDRRTVVSRHDFAMPEEPVFVTRPTTPPRPIAVQTPSRGAVASSRDSSVSIGVKQVRSPR